MIGIVDLSGGFGNQLFQYSLAFELQKIGYEVHIYDQEKLDYFEKKINGMKKANNFKLLMIQQFKNILYFEKKYIKNFKNSLNINTEAKQNDAYFAFFNGFWQNYDLVKDNKEDIKKLIEHQDISSSNVENNKGKTFVHVRRTDYVGFGENLDTEYYRKALNYIKENKGNYPFHVFTDDYKWVKSQKIFKDAEHIEINNNNLRDKEIVFKTFSEMSNYENYITANSTFSWWAAVLNQNKDLIKICPDPYFRNDDGTRNLYDNTWIKISRN